MNIELKNVKFSEWASQETSCFEATLYIDGKRRGRVSNDGGGGPHYYDDYDAARELTEHGKTLPRFDFIDGTYVSNIQPDDPLYANACPPDGDTLVCNALNNWLMDRDVKRLLSKRIVFSRDGQLLETRAFKKDELNQLLADPDLETKLNADAGSILNLKSIAEARALLPGMEQAT